MNPATTRSADLRDAGERPSGRGPLILFNKPYGVLCQFSADGSGKPTLKDFVPVRHVYPAGRLDVESEGLVILTANGTLQALIANPRHHVEKTYWAQVEGVPGPEQIAALAAGVALREFVAAPIRVRVIATPPGLWPRDPPIRARRAIPTRWLELVLQEGKNRQVRRMTAAVGLPTLRLIRWAVGPWTLEGLATGVARIETLSAHVLSSPPTR